MDKNLICHNDIVDSIKKYDPVQLKLFYNMLYKFKVNNHYQNGDICDEIEIYLDEIKQITKKGHHTKDCIKDIINNMPREIFYDKDNKYGVQSVFSYINYDFEDDCMRYKLDEVFGEYLIQILEKFTIIELNELASLSSKYSQRLYELARRYLGQNHFRMKIEDFRSYFRIPESYKMCNIDKKVLEPATKQLNKNTNIVCSYKKEKKGKNISHILFTFIKK